MTGRTLPDTFEAAEIRYYDNVSEMMKAVDNGEVDYVYGISAMIEISFGNQSAARRTGACSRGTAIRGDEGAAGGRQ